MVRTWAFNHRLPALNPAWLQHEKPYDSGSSSSNSSSSSSTTSYLAGCLTDTNGGSACAAGLPLVWDEAEFVGLDWVVARAEAAGVRLVLALGNLWPACEWAVCRWWEAEAGGQRGLGTRGVGGRVGWAGRQVSEPCHAPCGMKDASIHARGVSFSNTWRRS